MTRHPFEQRIIDLKARVKPAPFDWYRFDTFSALTHFDRLLPNGLQSVMELAGDEPVADIGTGDGDLAFLFESLGRQVTALDWPGTNANQMRGVNLAKRELNSSVAIREVDLDGQFRLDHERFGLVLSLGLLYHLKNPYYFLETLAAHARHCILSTAILPRRKTKDAIAYLATNGEFENDPTNYWFFSEAGMLRLMDRCGWDIVRTNITGKRRDRFFCHAESRIAKASPVIRLLEGWHEPENRAWRWTKRNFAASIENAEGATLFELRFRMVQQSALTVLAEVNGETLPVQHYNGPGDFVYAASIAPASRKNTVRVRLSGIVEADGRELGVIVHLPPDTIIDDGSGIRLL